MAVGMRLASAQPPRSPIDDFSEAIEKLIRQVNPAVLEIVTESYGGSESESGGNTSVVTRRQALGTGVFVSADGDMLTNAHVVAGAKKVRVRMRGSARAGGKLVEDAEFYRVTAAGLQESHAHDVSITEEAPNYRSSP